jgi:sialate O-acetylesterase
MDIVTKADQQIANYPGALAKFKAEEATLMAQWNKDVAAAKAAGKKEPGKPRPPSDPLGSYLAPMARFNGMLHPLLPLGLRGVIWYQGESNVSRYEQYRTLVPTMLADWRARWQRPDLPLLMVELAPYKGSKPDFREVQQRLAREIPGVGLVTTVDVGDSNDIHPPNKRPVGERLALLARKQVYGEDVVASGPRFANATFPAGKAVVTFTDLAGGLVASGGVLKGFTLAGADGNFMDATATIVGETVEVTAPGVAAPTAVRYAWAPAPVATLTSKAGLPAFPFRSDQPGL